MSITMHHLLKENLIPRLALLEIPYLSRDYPLSESFRFALVVESLRNVKVIISLLQIPPHSSSLSYLNGQPLLISLDPSMRVSKTSTSFQFIVDSANKIDD